MLSELFHKRSYIKDIFVSDVREYEICGWKEFKFQIIYFGLFLLFRKIYHNKMKTSTQLNYSTSFEFDLSLHQDYPVSFQTQSQCQLLKVENKKQKAKLFKQVYDFIHLLIEDKHFYQTIKQFLTRDEKPPQKNENQMVDESEENNKLPFQNVSFKKMPMSSKNCFESFRNSKSSTTKDRSQRRGSKKISIVIYANAEEEEIFNGSDELFSDEELKSLRQIKLPNLKLTQELIKQIYQAPSPFLMNLSLCLFLRYCIRRNLKPQWNDSAWILAVSTIQAFKIYYDEQLQGMFECFESVLKIPRQDLVDLQRCFLQQIDYNVIIRNYDYQYVLARFVQMEKLEKKQTKYN